MSARDDEKAATPSVPGLRERKKQRTRETIASVALDLFDRQGYDATTLDDIAQAADVSKRTIFTYYQGKEDLLFHDEPRLLLEIDRRLRSRAPGVTTVEALGALLVDFRPDPTVAARKRVIGGNESLRLAERARFARIETLLAGAIRDDLGAAPDDVRPLLIAASVTAAFNVVYDRMLTDAGTGRNGHADAVEAFEQLLDLLRSGVETLQRPRS